MKVVQLKLLECDRCSVRFLFNESSRISRAPRCPACGSLDAQEIARQHTGRAANLVRRPTG